MKYENMRLLRLEKRLSQIQVAKSINCSQRAYSHYERGERKIPNAILVALARYFDVSVDYILGVSNERH